LTIIAATIGPALRNTLESTPINLIIEIVTEVVIIEVVDVINVRPKAFADKVMAF